MLKNRNQLPELLNDLGLFGNGIEIGVSRGTYSVIILQKSKLSKLYLLDLWKELPITEYQENSYKTQEMMDERLNDVIKKTEIYKNRIEIIRKDSREAFKDFEDGFFDFIYIDANHSYQYVKTDMENWYPKLKIGGVFSGHDYVLPTKRNRFCGVRKAVDEFCSKVNKTPIIIPKSYHCPDSWFFIKI